MTITKCDNCGAVVEPPKDYVSIGRGSLVPTVQLCASCGAPAADLLDRVIARRRVVKARGSEATASLHTGVEALQ